MAGWHPRTEAERGREADFARLKLRRNLKSKADLKEAKK